MGSSSLVTAKITSPPDSSQEPADSSRQSAAEMSSGSRPVSWVNIPITRTVNTIMASVVEELQQQQQTRVLGQYSHHQDCEHHHGQRGGGAPAAAAAAGSEESAVERGADPGQGHQPQIQGGTLQVPESQQESRLPLP